MTDFYREFVERMRNNGVARQHFYLRIDVFQENFRRKIVNPSAVGGSGETRQRERFFPSDEGATYRQLFTPKRLQTIGLMCKSIAMPEREFEIMEETIKPGYVNRIASHRKAPNEIEAKFYCSPDLNEQRFIENWMNMVINPFNGYANYYEEYAKYNTMTLFNLPRSYAGTTINEEIALNAPGGPIYFVKMFECYPFAIESTVMENENAEKIYELSVKFYYKYSKTITDLNFVSVKEGYDRSVE